MIYITGDCHADWRRFSKQAFPEQDEMSRDDFVIVCGDFGLWHDNKEEQYWLKWLEEKPFTILFVDGNHENFDRLYNYDVIDFYGGKAHKIAENVFHLMRGYVFTLQDKKFFAFGGASSHDIDDGILDESNFNSREEFLDTWGRWQSEGRMFRVNHKTWWSQEIPSADEMKFGLKTLEENNWNVDYVISHCCPQTVASMFSRGLYKPDVLTQYFDDIAKKLNFDKWYFGHYHDDLEIMGKYILQYYNISRVV